MLLDSSRDHREGVLSTALCSGPRMRTLTALESSFGSSLGSSRVCQEAERGENSPELSWGFRGKEWAR